MVKNRIYATLLSLLLTLTMFATGCSGKSGDSISDIPASSVSNLDDDFEEDNGLGFEEEPQDDSYAEVQDILSRMLFEDVVEKIGDVSLVDDYLKSVNYESLVSDYVGFRDCGDMDSASQTLYQLGMHILKGTVLEMLCSKDEEFAARLGTDFTLDDVDVTIENTYNEFCGIVVTVDGGEKYAQLVTDGDFTVGYGVRGYGSDLLGFLFNLQAENGYHSVTGLQNAFKFFKEFMVYETEYDKEGSVMDGLACYDGMLLTNNMNFKLSDAKVLALKKEIKTNS